eukprot:206765-Chlamydomonas_euryale.AAC.3
MACPAATSVATAAASNAIALKRKQTSLRSASPLRITEGAEVDGGRARRRRSRKAASASEDRAGTRISAPQDAPVPRGTPAAHQTSLHSFLSRAQPIFGGTTTRSTFHAPGAAHDTERGGSGNAPRRHVVMPIHRLATTESSTFPR